MDAERISDQTLGRNRREEKATRSDHRLSHGCRGGGEEDNNALQLYAEGSVLADALSVMMNKGICLPA